VIDDAVPHTSMVSIKSQQAAHPGGADAAPTHLVKCARSATDTPSRFGCDRGFTDQEVRQGMCDRDGPIKCGIIRANGADSAPNISIEHAPTCGVRCKNWDDCNCGLHESLLTLRSPYTVINHKPNCPCHCTCDFMLRLVEFLEDD
jgi:hypothetical protein